MSINWHEAVATIGVAAAERKIGRELQGAEYTAICAAVEAMVEHVVLIPSVTIDELEASGQFVPRVVV